MAGSGGHVFPYAEARVRDAMTSPIRACAPDLRLEDVADLMASARVHCVVVHSEAGGSESVISDLDLVRAATEPRFSARTAGEIATDPAVAIAADAALPEAAALMAERALSHLLVRDPDSGAPVGVLSSFDVLRALAWGQPPRVGG